MNILVFTSLWPNGEQPNFGIFVRHRIAALARLEGVRVRAVAPVPYFPRPLAWPFIPAHWQRAARIPERETIAGIETYHPRYLVTPKVGMSFYGGWMARGAARVMRQLHAQQPCELIDAHYGYPDGLAAVQLARALGVPVVITARGTDIHLYSQLPRIRPLLREALAGASGVIAVSASLKQSIVELGIEAEKVTVIRNGVNREIFYPRERAAARRKLGLEPDARIIVTVASLTPNKGIDRLLDAMALVARQRADAYLYIIGAGPERAALAARLAGHHLSGRAFLVGARPQAELPDWYAAADLFCLASHREGCPNVVIEAMACGVPVVATDAGGISELVTSPAYGRLVSSPSPVEEVAARVGEALKHEWDRAAIAAHGGARSWEDVAMELMPYYAARGFIGP
jgi:teichuronic acid biosynthesis glycosyltransferase TuaC